MIKALKWTMISLAACAVFLAAVLGTAHLYLSTDQGARRLLGMINTLYPGTITGSAVEVSLLRQEVVVKDAVLLGPDGRRILGSERVSLRMDLPALTGLDLVFVSIDAVRPDFVLEVDEDGWLNIEAAFVEKTPGEGPINVYIRNLTCADGTFVYRAESGEPVLRLRNFDLTMDSAFEHDSLLHFSVPKTSIELFVAGEKLDLGSGSASCTIFNDQVTDIRAFTTMGSTRATLTGSITDMAQKAQFDLDLALDGDMADLRDILRLTDRTGGRVQADIRATRDYDDPDFACALSYGGGTIEGLALGAARLDGTVTDRVATIDRLTGSFASGTLDIAGTVDMRRMFPDGYFEGLKEEDAIAYDLVVSGTSLLLDDIPGLPEELRGRISPRIELKGSGISRESLRIAAAFQARGSGVTAGPVLDREDVSADGKVTFGGDRLAFETLNARTRTAEASASGSVDLGSHAVDGSVSLRAAQVGPLLARAGLRGSGNLAATVLASGTWDRPVVDIDARSEEAGLEGVTLGTVTFKALLDETGRLNVSSLSLDNKGSLVTARGDILLFRRFPDLEPDPGIDLVIDLAGVTASDFTAKLPLEGVLDGRILAAGTLNTLSADIGLTGSDLSVSGVRLGHAALAGVLSGGVLNVSSLEVTNRSSTLLATGEVTLFEGQRMRLIEDPPLRLKVLGNGLLIEDFTDLARGTMSVSADLDGTVRRPTGTAKLLAGQIDLGFQRFDSLDVQASSDGDIIWFEPAVLTIAGEENINARGSITLGGAYEFSLGTPGISMENVDLIREYESARGTIFVHATGQGLLSNPSLAGRLSAAEIEFMDTPMEDMTFAFALEDRTLTVDGAWNFRMNLQHDLATGDISAHALFAETELAPLFTLAGRKTLTGRLTGRVDTKGNIRAPRDMDIDAEISSLDIAHDGRDIVEAHDVNASYRQGLVNLPLTRISLAGRGLLDIQAQGEVSRTLTLDADGVIPMEVLGLFAEDLSDSTGIVRVSSQVRAQGLRPDFSAVITLEDLAWTLPFNGQRLHSVNGKADLRNSRLTVEGITGRLDTGAFQMGGTATFKGFTPSTVELMTQTKSLPIVIPDMMDVTVDAEASFDLSGTRSRLWADAVILDGVYYRDVNVNLFTGVLERIISGPQRERPKEDLSLPWPFLETTTLDVSIKRRGDVRVENNIAELDINPDLKVTGTLTNPVVNGRVAVTDGIVNFQNNEFTVSRGVIDFLDPYRTAANVDIQAKTQVRDWDITLGLEGELENLQLTLSSVPSEEPADILSLLIVGKTSRELTQEQTSVAVSPSGMIAELLTSTYGSDIKKATTLDILELKASDFATSEGGESMTLLVGKELTRRMTVKYQMETRESEMIQRAIAEYKILENLLINGYQSSDGTFGTDLLYRHEFR